MPTIRPCSLLISFPATITRLVFTKLSGIIGYIHQLLFRVGCRTHTFGMTRTACRLLQYADGDVVSSDLFNNTFVFNHEVIL